MAKKQEQGAIGGERGDGDLDQARVADVFRPDLEAVRQGATHQVGANGPWRQSPARRPFAIVGSREL